MELKVQGEIKFETETGYQLNSRLIDLLNLINNTGSLNIAVKELGMSYSYAWNILYKTNCQLKTPIVILHRGGKGGGLAELTDEGKNLLDYYCKLRNDSVKFLLKKTIQL